MDPNPFDSMASLCCCPNHISYVNTVEVTADGGTTTETIARSSYRQALAAGMTLVGELPIAEIPRLPLELERRTRRRRSCLIHPDGPFGGLFLWAEF